MPVDRVIMAPIARRKPRLLVLRALGLGDLLTGVPALRALRRAFPDHTLELATSAPLTPLVQLGGLADELIAAEPLAPLPRRARGADIAVNLHGSGPESHRLLIAARPRRLIAFAQDELPLAGLHAEWQDQEHDVSRWCRLLREHGIEADESELDLPAPALPAPAAAAGATLIHPGAASIARRWPVERWRELIDYELAAGRRVVLTGGPDEIAIADELAGATGLPHESNLAGRTGLLELASAVAAASLVICGDTGVAHLATALGTPSVVLFGPVPPSLWGPPAARPIHVALWAGTSGDPHGDSLDAGLARISVGDVLRATGRLRGELRGSTGEPSPLLTA